MCQNTTMRVYGPLHELKHISFYVQKRVVAMGMCYNPALVRDKPLGLTASVKWVYWNNVQNTNIHILRNLLNPAEIKSMPLCLIDP